MTKREGKTGKGKMKHILYILLKFPCLVFFNSRHTMCYRIE